MAGTIVFQGWLERQGGDAWIARYFVLFRPHYLLYFESEAVLSPKVRTQRSLATYLRRSSDSLQYELAVLHYFLLESP